MRKNLILYGKSGFSSQTQDLLNISRSLNDYCIVLKQDAVVGVVMGSSIGIETPNTRKNSSDPNLTVNYPYFYFQSQKIPLFCLIEDLEARGYSTENLPKNIQGISYMKLVDLIDSSQRIISWL